MGKDSSYQHMRVFNCLVHMHVAKDQRSNLHNKSKPCIFLGYLEDDFDFRLWDFNDKKAVRKEHSFFGRQYDRGLETTEVGVDSLYNQLKTNRTDTIDYSETTIGTTESKSVDSEQPTN